MGHVLRFCRTSWWKMLWDKTYADGSEHMSERIRREKAAAPLFGAGILSLSGFSFAAAASAAESAAEAAAKEFQKSAAAAEAAAEAASNEFQRWTDSEGDTSPSQRLIDYSHL